MTKELEEDVVCGFSRHCCAAVKGIDFDFPGFPPRGKGHKMDTILGTVPNPTAILEAAVNGVSFKFRK